MNTSCVIKVAHGSDCNTIITNFSENDVITTAIWSGPVILVNVAQLKLIHFTLCTFTHNVAHTPAGKLRQINKLK